MRHDISILCFSYSHVFTILRFKETLKKGLEWIIKFICFSYETQSKEKIPNFSYYQFLESKG